MNQLKKKIVYYYLVITAVVLIAEWNLYRFIYEYSHVLSKKTGINEIVFNVSGGILVVFLLCVVAYIYYGKVNKIIVKESERQVKERNILFANIAHDLKNPMASVLGYARALEENAVPTEEQGHIYHLIADKSNQMNDMILKMFQYAKMGSDGYSLNFVETDICELVRNVIVNRFDEIEKHNIELDVDIPEEKILYNVDVMEFPRVIGNLISNAIKHNEDGIKIRVAVECINDKIRIQVADSGGEIPKELGESLFEPFECSDASRVTKDGSGLGLAITKRIVTLHKGTITIEYNEPGYTKAFVILM